MGSMEKYIFLSEDLKGRYILRNLVVDGRILLTKQGIRL
jgi:hypothetical protein